MTPLRERLSGKRFGVVLSAGYFGFFGHAGFVEALLGLGLRPACWAGTSAGGLVAAFAASGAPLDELRQLLLELRREHFWDPDVLGALKDAVRGGSRATGLLAGRRFRALLQRHLPASFAACAEPLLLVATDLSAQAAHAMDSGDLPSAVHATCAYPGMFQAVRRDGRLLWDGGIVDKAPALALAGSPQGGRLDALLVHYLPSRDGAAEPRGPFAWPAGLAQGMAALRKDHFRLQLEVLRARGLEVHVVTSRLPGVGPRALHRGPEALAAGAEAARRALAAAPRPWSGED